MRYFSVSCVLLALCVIDGCGAANGGYEWCLSPPPSAKVIVRMVFKRSNE